MRSDALLLTGDWQIYAPMLYFQDVERMRPDVTAIEVGMLNRSWYVDQIERQFSVLREDLEHVDQVSRVEVDVDRFAVVGDRHPDVRLA